MNRHVTELRERMHKHLMLWPYIKVVSTRNEYLDKYAHAK